MPGLLAGRVARHAGVSTMRRHGMGFWDSFDALADVADVADDFAVADWGSIVPDFQVDALSWGTDNAAALTQSIADVTVFDPSPFDLEDFDAGQAAMQGEYIPADTPDGVPDGDPSSHVEVDTGDESPNELMKAAPAAASVAARAMDNGSGSKSGASQAVPRASSGSPDAGLTLSTVDRLISIAAKAATTDAQLQAAKARLTAPGSAAAVPAGYTRNAAGQLVPIGGTGAGVLSSLVAKVKANPVPFALAAGGLVLLLVSTGRSASRSRYRKNPGARSRDTRTSTDASVRSPTRTSTKANTRGNITVTGGAGRGSRTIVNLGRKRK